MQVRALCPIRSHVAQRRRGTRRLLKDDECCGMGTHQACTQYSTFFPYISMVDSMF